MLDASFLSRDRHTGTSTVNAGHVWNGDISTGIWDWRVGDLRVETRQHRM